MDLWARKEPAQVGFRTKYHSLQSLNYYYGVNVTH
jgi:hypothetical protein